MQREQHSSNRNLVKRSHREGRQQLDQKKGLEGRKKKGKAQKNSDTAALRRSPQRETLDPEDRNKSEGEIMNQKKGDEFGQGTNRKKK